jgi:pilus assembly protein CpaB
MFKKIIPVILAILVFVVAFVLLQPAPSTSVVVAAHDLRAGHVLTESDVELRALPADAISPDTATDITAVIGQSLRIDRGTGDVIRSTQLGELITLQPDERALAINISDTTGIAGLLLPGQKVGVVATIANQAFDTQGFFSKAVIEGLRVLYIDPRFAASAVNSVQAVSTPDSMTGFNSTVQERSQEGVVVLAVPIRLQTILYDFTSENAESEARQVNAIELLAALSTADGAHITLYLMPGEDITNFSSPGLWLPDLVVTPQTTATTTPTPTAEIP